MNTSRLILGHFLDNIEKNIDTFKRSAWIVSRNDIVQNRKNPLISTVFCKEKNAIVSLVLKEGKSLYKLKSSSFEQSCRPIQNRRFKYWAWHHRFEYWTDIKEEYRLYYKLKDGRFVIIQTDEEKFQIFGYYAGLKLSNAPDSFHNSYVLESKNGAFEDKEPIPLIMKNKDGKLVPHSTIKNLENKKYIL